MMRWFIHTIIRWQDARTLEKRYFAQLQNGRRGHSSRRWFRTASQAKLYAESWCARVNRSQEYADRNIEMERENDESR